jgi:hypothetical protein
MVGQFRYFRSRLPESEQAKFDRWFDRVFSDLEAMDTELGMQKFSRVKNEPMEGYLDRKLFGQNQV